MDEKESLVMMEEYENGEIGVINERRWEKGKMNELRMRINGEKGEIEIMKKKKG